MFDVPAHLINMLEKAWELSFVNNSEASTYLAGIRPQLTHFVSENQNQANNIRLIEVVIDGGIRFHSKQYTDALTKILDIVADLKSAESMSLWLARAYGLLGVTYRQLGDRSLAAEYLIKRLEIAQEIDGIILQRNSYNSLANLYADAQDHERAVEYFELCVPLVRQVGEVFMATFCFSNLAESLIQLERFAEAKAYLEEAIEITQGEDFIFPRSVPVHVLGQLETVQGNFELGLSHYQEAQQLNATQGNDYTEIRILQGLGQLYLAWEKPKSAIDYFDTALALCHKLGNRALALPIMEQRAQTLYEIGEYQKSAESYRQLNHERSEIFQEQTEFHAQNLQVRYETEAAQKEAELLQEQNHLLEDMVAERTQELEQQRDQLEQLNVQKNAFLMVLTHDMRSPLTTIGLYAELIRRKPEPITHHPHYLDSIVEAQKALSQLVDNMLDLEKLEAGQSIEITTQPIDLVELVEATVAQYLKLASRREVQLTFSAEQKRVIVNADGVQLERAVTNLISNAINYTPTDGDVTVAVSHDNTHASIVVEDTGLGIEESLLEKIFIRYYRVDTHSGRGTGLGLPIVKAIIDAHKGEINVESTPQEGSQFTVLLPLP